MNSGKNTSSISAADVPPAIPTDPASYDAAIARLDEIGELLVGDPEDVELLILMASTSLRCADIRMAQGSDPTFLLQDAERYATRATSVERVWSTGRVSASSVK